VISNEPKRTLPHREPFLWVSRLIERNDDGTEGVVEFDVSPEESLFRGHFPGKPIFPGVIQMEAAAQACGWIHLGVRDPDAPPPEVLFVGVDTYKFKKPVVPPAMLRITARQAKAKSRLHLWEVEIHSEGALVSKGSFWLQLLSS
jgi:3-hydroxyacyl-[acyl-carrier-protein] dehydratase